jgi:hypothetical protein
MSFSDINSNPVAVFVFCLQQTGEIGKSPNFDLPGSYKVHSPLLHTHKIILNIYNLRMFEDLRCTG